MLAVDQGAVYDRLKSVLHPESVGAGLRLRWEDRAEAGAGPLPRCVLTLGTRSLQMAVSRSRESSAWGQVPVLAALVPRATYWGLAAQLPKKSSAIWLDQPLERYMALLRAALPRHRRVGVLVGPSSPFRLDAIETAAGKQGLQVVHAVVQAQVGSVFPGLQAVLGACDVLLVLPDPSIYNADSLQNILIASYRQRVPLVSYAAAHAPAGATLALHTPVDSVAAQALSALRHLAQNPDLPAPQGPAGLGVAVNDQVARSLGLDVWVPSDLEAAVRRLEGRS